MTTTPTTVRLPIWLSTILIAIAVVISLTLGMVMIDISFYIPDWLFYASLPLFLLALYGLFALHQQVRRLLMRLGTA